jgi:hypothetical protein
MGNQNGGGVVKSGAEARRVEGESSPEALEALEGLKRAWLEASPEDREYIRKLVEAGKS